MVGNCIVRFIRSIVSIPRLKGAALHKITNIKVAAAPVKFAGNLIEAGRVEVSIHLHCVVIQITTVHIHLGIAAIDINAAANAIDRIGGGIIGRMTSSILRNLWMGAMGTGFHADIRCATIEIQATAAVTFIVAPGKIIADAAAGEIVCTTINPNTTAMQRNIAGNRSTGHGESTTRNTNATTAAASYQSLISANGSGGHIDCSAIETNSTAMLCGIIGQGRAFQIDITATRNANRTAANNAGVISNCTARQI